MCSSLFQNILKAKAGNSDAMLDLISKFNPLLKKYSTLLNYDDAFCDLQAFFIETIQMVNWDRLKNKSDGGTITYIQKAVRSKYISLNKEKESEHLFLLPAKSTDKTLTHSISDEYNNLLRMDLLNILTQKEYNLIFLHYICGYSVAEISRQWDVSRQAINQKKLLALKKLEKHYHPSVAS